MSGRNFKPLQNVPVDGWWRRLLPHFDGQSGPGLAVWRLLVEAARISSPPADCSVVGPSGFVRKFPAVRSIYQRQCLIPAQRDIGNSAYQLDKIARKFAGFTQPKDWTNDRLALRAKG